MNGKSYASKVKTGNEELTIGINKSVIPDLAFGQNYQNMSELHAITGFNQSIHAPLKENSTIYVPFRNVDPKQCASILIDDATFSMHSGRCQPNLTIGLELLFTTEKSKTEIIPCFVDLYVNTFIEIDFQRGVDYLHPSGGNPTQPNYINAPLIANLIQRKDNHDVWIQMHEMASEKLKRNDLKKIYLMDTSETMHKPDTTILPINRRRRDLSEASADNSAQQKEVELAKIVMEGARRSERLHKKRHQEIHFLDQLMYQQQQKQQEEPPK